MAFNIANIAGSGMDIPASSMPLLHLLQKGSAAVDETHPDYPKKKIEDARPGMIVFNPDDTVYKEIEILPVKFLPLYAEWAPRNEGGGLKAHHSLDIIRSPKYRPRDPNNKKSKEMLGANELIQTTYLALKFRHRNGEWTDGILSFTGSQLSASRSLGKMIQKFVFPETSRFKGSKTFSFAQSYTLSTTVQSNEEGSWYVFTFKPGRVMDKPEDEAVLELTAAFAETVGSGNFLPSPGAAMKQALPAPAASSSSAVDDSDEPAF